MQRWTRLFMIIGVLAAVVAGAYFFWQKTKGNSAERKKGNLTEWINFDPTSTSAAPVDRFALVTNAITLHGIVISARKTARIKFQDQTEELREEEVAILNAPSGKVNVICLKIRRDEVKLRVQHDGKIGELNLRLPEE
jgi:hypothetical protein